MSAAGQRRGQLYTVAEFTTAPALLEAVRRIREAGFHDLDTYTPFPVQQASEALGLKRSRVPPIALFGALSGLALAYGFQYFMNAVSYPLNVGNRPPHSAPAFVPITFELAVLFSALSIFFGLLFLSRLPRPYHPVFEHEAFRSASTHGFWLSVAGTRAGEDVEKLESSLKELGGSNVATVAEDLS